MKVVLRNVVTAKNRRHGVSVGPGVELDADGLVSYANGGDGVHMADAASEESEPKPGKFRRVGRLLSSVAQGAIGGALGNWISGA